MKANQGCGVAFVARHPTDSTCCNKNKANRTSKNKAQVVNTTEERLYGVADVVIRRLQAAQNAAARLITGIRRNQHITPTLRD